VLINAELQILQFRGSTSAYLEPPTGNASFNLLKMAREGLLLPLRDAVNKAKKENKSARKENVRLDHNGKTRMVNLEVIPLKNLRERCFLILFEDTETGGRTVAQRVELRGGFRTARPSSKKAESHRVTALEAELSETRDYLQSIQEQHEAANEELQASNEEVQSANEELQSINEELETSKEELESANEELTTVNEEMASRNIELTRLNADLTNLQTSTKLPIVLVGRELIIRRFSSTAEKIFNLLATDIGRTLGGVRHNLIVPEMERAIQSGGDTPPYPVEALVREVIDTVREQEREVCDKDGRWYSLRVRPYMTLDNKVDGAVLVLVETTDLKRAELQAKAARDYAEAIVRTARDPMIVLRQDLRVDTANQAFYKTFKTTPDQAEGASIYELGNRQWNIPQLRMFLEEILPRNSFFNDFEVTHDFPQLGRRTMLLNGRTLDQQPGTPALILLTIEDVTERQRADERVRISEIRYRRLFEAARDGVLILDSISRKIIDVNPFVIDLLGYTREELLGKELWQLGMLKDEQSSHGAFRELQQRGLICYEDLPLQTKSGEKREVEVVANCYDESGKQVIQFNIRDITRRNGVHRALRDSEERYRLLVEGATGFALIMLNLEGGVTSWNVGAERLLGYSEAEILGQNFSRFFTLEDQAAGKPHGELETAARNEEGPDDNWLVRKDGQRFWASGATTAVRDEKGGLRGFTKIVRDTTERKQAAEALAQSHDELQAHAEELRRFNRAAVERELRMIELKKEINELCQRQGEPARYPLEFEQERNDGDD
jgi:PAS domain S-box-containing protein